MWLCVCVLPRGQESAGIVISDGASPPTYTVHKVKKTPEAVYNHIEGTQAALTVFKAWYHLFSCLCFNFTLACSSVLFY